MKKQSQSTFFSSNGKSRTSFAMWMLKEINYLFNKYNLLVNINYLGNL